MFIHVETDTRYQQNADISDFRLMQNGVYIAYTSKNVHQKNH